jgi:hypothetical protein
VTRSFKKNFQSEETKINNMKQTCWRFQRGTCPDGDRCRFAHVEAAAKRPSWNQNTENNIYIPCESFGYHVGLRLVKHYVLQPGCRIFPNDIWTVILGFWIDDDEKTNTRLFKRWKCNGCKAQMEILNQQEFMWYRMIGLHLPSVCRKCSETKFLKPKSRRGSIAEPIFQGPKLLYK